MYVVKYIRERKLPRTEPWEPHADIISKGVEQRLSFTKIVFCMLWRIEKT